MTGSIYFCFSFFLALNPDCQEKVYQQIKEAVEENDGDPDLDYAAYQKMEYLEQCITEANRIYPISKFLFGHDFIDCCEVNITVLIHNLFSYFDTVILERRVTKPWPVPGTDFVMPKDSLVTVPITQMAVDPKYYETPEKFNPDHFSPESVSKRGPYVDGKR